MTRIFHDRSKGQTAIIGSYVVEFDEEGFGVLEDDEYAETLCKDIPEYKLAPELPPVASTKVSSEPDSKPIDSEPDKKPEEPDKENAPKRKSRG